MFVVSHILKILLYFFLSLSVYPALERQSLSEVKITNNNNSLHSYSAFMGTQNAFHRRGNLLVHHQCAASTWMMRRQSYCARTANQCIGIIRRHDGQRPMGEFGQNAGITPLLFFEGHPGIFNDHRESGPRFKVSSERRCFFWQNSVPITILGR